MARVAGTAFLKINGRSYSTTGEFDIKILGSKAEPIVSSDGDIHYAEVVVADTISGDIITTPGLSEMAVGDIRNATIQIECRNGAVALLQNAFFSGDAAVSTKDGTMAVEFTGRGKWI